MALRANAISGAFLLGGVHGCIVCSLFPGMVTLVGKIKSIDTKYDAAELINRGK